jgi:hypothetical protein
MFFSFLGGFFMTAPVYNLTRGFFPYISDNTNTYTVASTVGNANANSTPPSPGDPDANPTYPRGWVPRKVHGSYVSGGTTYRTDYIAFNPTDLGWLSTNLTFTKGGQTFTIEGRIGERRTYKGG